MLRATARLHRHQARCAIGEVLQELPARQSHVHDLARLQVDSVQLKHPLRRIHAHDRSDSLHLGPSGLPGKTASSPLAHRCRRPARVHRDPLKRRHQGWEASIPFSCFRGLNLNTTLAHRDAVGGRRPLHQRCRNRPRSPVVDDALQRSGRRRNELLPVGSALEAESAIIDRLRDRSALLVVDEAHHLRDKLLDELRIIRDRSGCGLALVADKTIEIALARCAQVDGRIGIKLDLTMQAVADIEDIIAGAIGRKPSKAELKTLDEIGRGPGGLRALRRLLGRAWMVAQGDGHDDITASDIDAAVEQGVAADDAAPARAAE